MYYVYPIASFFRFGPDTAARAKSVRPADLEPGKWVRMIGWGDRAEAIVRDRILVRASTVLSLRVRATIEGLGIPPMAAPRTDIKALVTLMRDRAY